MGDLIIKPASSGNLKIQDQGGTERISLNTSGITTFASNTTFSGTGNNIGTATAGTLGSSVTNNAGVAAGTIASGVTIASGINMPDFDWNLSSGENRIITFGSKGFALYGVVDATGTGNSSARTGVYGNSSSSGSFKVIYMNGQIGKTGTRGDIGHFKFQTDTLYVVSRVQGYFMGPSSNDVGEGTLSPTVNRWSAQTNSSEDYELQLASPDGGTFYYYFFGIKS